jgi:flagellar protein FlaJ
MSTPEVDTPPADVSSREYGIDGRRRSLDVDDDERRRLRREYGRVRTAFKLRPQRHRGLQRALSQARIGATYDEYLTDSVRYGLAAALVGFVLGALLAYGLAVAGVFAGLTSPVRVGGPLAEAVAANRELVVGGALSLLLAALFGVATWSGRYYWPTTVVSSRRQNIEVTLPHAITYLYALSLGGMSLVESMDALADAEDVYGEVSREFETVVTDVELFGSDVYTALQNARNLTPSDGMEQFLDDLVGVLDSGASVTAFLESEADSYLRQAEEEQEDFLETLSLLAEVFVVAFVAAPLFLIVTLVVISLIGGSTVTQVSLLVYLVIPVSMVAFLVLLDVLSAPFAQGRGVPDAATHERPSVPDADDERVAKYARRQRRLALRDLVETPFATVASNPLYSLAVTVPLAFLAVAVPIASGSIGLSLDALLDAPIRVTSALVVVPLFVVAGPLALFHELKRRRETEIARRFPDTLNVLSSANKMGIPLVDALGLVSRWSEGVVATEIRRVRNDVSWNHDTTGALLAFAARLRVPQLSRTMKLLADGLRSSGDLSRVLSVAAEDTRNRARMERARRRELSSYVAVVVIGFLVYLLVVVLLDASYLTPISEVGDGATDSPVSLANVPVETYRAVFFHSSLVVAVGSGLIAGKLSDDDILSGLKYALAMVAISVIAFTVI